MTALPGRQRVTPRQKRADSVRDITDLADTA